MRIKDAETALLAGLAGRLPLEADKDVGQRGGIIPGLSRGADADAVSLALLAAAIAAQPGPADDLNGRVDQRAEIFADHTANDAARQREQAGQNALALLAGGVPLGDVGDFMGQHAGQFIFAFGQDEQPTGHVDAPAGNREGVGFLLVNDVKGKLPARVACGRDEAPADLLQVALRLRE